MALTKSERQLFNAVTKGDVKQVKTLIKKVGDLDFEGDYGRTPLEEAISKGRLLVVKALIEGGASINRVNDYGQTPFDLATSRGNTKIANYLKGEGGYEADDWRVNTTTSLGARYDADDDDYYGYDDDGYHPRKTSKKSTARPKAARANFGASSEGGKTAPEKADQPVKPKFTEETLKDIFNAKSWVGKTEEMEKLWEDVPAKLQKKFDFDTALAEAKRETLKKNAPTAPKLSFAPPANPVTQNADNSNIPVPPAPNAPNKPVPPANA